MGGTGSDALSICGRRHFIISILNTQVLFNFFSLLSLPPNRIIALLHRVTVAWDCPVAGYRSSSVTRIQYVRPNVCLHPRLAHAHTLSVLLIRSVARCGSGWRTEPYCSVSQRAAYVLQFYSESLCNAFRASASAWVVAVASFPVALPVERELNGKRQSN